MEIDRNRIKENLDELANRDDEKGMQPELTLGCFYDLKREDDEFCRGCSFYWKCSDVLNGYKIKEE